jgi:hypothetical protein
MFRCLWRPLQRTSQGSDMWSAAGCEKPNMEQTPAMFALTITFAPCDIVPKLAPQASMCRCLWETSFKISQGLPIWSAAGREIPNTKANSIDAELFQISRQIGQCAGAFGRLLPKHTWHRLHVLCSWLLRDIKIETAVVDVCSNLDTHYSIPNNELL